MMVAAELHVGGLTAGGRRQADRGSEKRKKTKRAGGGGEWGVGGEMGGEMGWGEQRRRRRRARGREGEGAGGRRRSGAGWGGGVEGEGATSALGYSALCRRRAAASARVRPGTADE